MFTMKCSRGDIVLVLFPDSNLRTAKRRPTLVVQADSLNTGLQQTVVAMISSNTARAGHPSRVLISLRSAEGSRSGLKADSVILTDNLATILDNEIDQVIGSLSDVEPVNTALKHTLAL
jgi:mRNA interferase MazF